MTRFQRFYVKHLIKSPVFFYSFLLFFVALFLVMSLTLQLNEYGVYDAIIEGDKISVEAADTSVINSHVYYYVYRSEHVYSAKISEVEYRDGKTILTVSSGESEALPNIGAVTVELVSGTRSLLERIFMDAGRA